MKISKSAVAVALSSALLFGCDFDIGSENNATTPPTNPDNPGGGDETTPGVNYFAQLLDSTVDGTGQLRLKLSESKSDTAVDNIAVGFLTVDLTYQENDVITDGTAENAYVQLYTTTGTSNKDLRGELVLGAGNVKYRRYNANEDKYELSDTIGTYTVGEELKVTVGWTENEVTYSINDRELGTFPAINSAPVEYIALKLGDTKGKSNYEVLADNFKIYEGDASSNELIFEDDFDSYGLGHDLNEVRYNRAEDVMILSDELDNGEDNDNDNGGETPPSDDVTDNFDSYSVGMQIDVANPVYKTKNVAGDKLTSAVISDDFAKSGSNSLRIEDADPGTKPAVGREFADGAAINGSVSTSVYIPTDGYDSATYVFLGANADGSSGGRFTEVVFTSDKVRFRNENGQQVDLAPYNKDTWVDLTISWSGTDVTVNIDGTDYAGLTAQNTGGNSTPTAITLYVGDNASVETYSYFDNLNSDLF